MQLAFLPRKNSRLNNYLELYRLSTIWIVKTLGQIAQVASPTNRSIVSRFRLILTFHEEFWDDEDCSIAPDKCFAINASVVLAIDLGGKNTGQITKRLFMMLYVFNCWDTSTPEAAAHSASLFQTGWFVESLLTQTLIIHIIRTNRIPFLQSRSSWPLLVMSVIIMLAGISLPFLPLGRYLGFTCQSRFQSEPLSRVAARQCEPSRSYRVRTSNCAKLFTA